MKKILFTLGLAITIVFIACDKDEPITCDTPTVGTKNIVGKWKLAEYEEMIDELYYTHRTNDVNKDTAIINNTFTSKGRYIGNIVEEESEEIKTNRKVGKLFDSSVNAFLDIELKEKEYTYIKRKNKYSVEIEIKEDNTWEATYSTTTISYVRIFHKIENGDTIYIYNIDTVFDPQDISVQTKKGTWFWENNNSHQGYINAGPMIGIIKEVGENQMIIELSDSTNEDRENYNYSEAGYYTYDDVNNVFKKGEGTERKTYQLKTLNSKSSKWVTN